MTAEARPELFRNRDSYPGDYSYKDLDDMYPPVELDPWVTERPLMPQIKGGTYAWGRVADYIAAPVIRQAYKDTHGPFSGIDVCSALPITAQLFREEHKESQFYLARKVVTSFVHRLQMQDRRQELVEALVSDENKELRLGLTIATQYLLDRPRLTARSSPDKDVAAEISDDAKWLMYIFRNTTRVREQLVDTTSEDLLETKQPKKSIEQLLEDALEGRNTGNNIRKVAMGLARFCFPLKRPFTVFSLDNRTPEDILEDSIDSFPAQFKKTEFYKRAKAIAGEHFVADILQFPFQPDSFSLITSFEGYPFLFHDLSEDGHIQFAQSVAAALKPGGKALFFPWEFEESTFYERELLEYIPEYLAMAGLRISTRTYTSGELMDQMGERELALVRRQISPLFSEDPERQYTALIISKLKVVEE